MNVLLIGGTGVLSGAIVKESLKRGFKVTIVTRGKSNGSIPEAAEHIKGDFWDREFITKALEGTNYDAVIDFISRTKMDLEYSISVLHERVEQFVFISTACVYNTEIPGVKDEKAEKVLSTWNYSIEKWECECLLRAKSAELGFNYTIIRPCITYDNTRIPYGIMPSNGYHWTFIGRILAGKPIIRWDGGNARWNITRVEDFAVGAVGLIGNENAYAEEFNICGDEAYSWNDVLSCIEESLDVKIEYCDMSSEEMKKLFPQKAGEISGRALDTIVSNKKIKEVVKEFATNITLQEGINKTIASYKESNYQRGIDWRFDAECDRIILKYCEQKGFKSNKFKTAFVDYLGNATLKNKIEYYVFRNNWRFLILLYLYLNSKFFK